MLKSEIEPFAQAHIAELKNLRTELTTLFDNLRHDESEFTPETLQKMLSILSTAERGFYRFQVCMIDEHKMKERAEERARHCRLHHKDQ